MMLAGDDPFGAFHCVKKRYMSFSCIPDDNFMSTSPHYFLALDDPPVILWFT